MPRLFEFKYKVRMSMPQVEKSSLEFLRKLEKNNDRVWFKKNKPTYDLARANISEVAQAILDRLNIGDQVATESGSKSLYRVYRDVRFSKDKTPYTIWYSGYFRRATEALRGGYYFNIQPGGLSIVGGGFWGPNKEDLKLLREQIDSDSEPLRKALSNKSIIKQFGELQGAQLKTAPKGWAKDHPEIDLLRYKQFILRRSFSDAEVLSINYVDEVVKSFNAMRPFFDTMSMYLTTDLNGESTI